MFFFVLLRFHQYNTQIHNTTSQNQNRRVPATVEKEKKMISNKTLISAGAILLIMTTSLVNASSSSDKEEFQSKRSTMLSNVFGKRDCNFDCKSNNLSSCDQDCLDAGDQLNKFVVSACVGGVCYCGFDPAMYPTG